MTSFSHWCLLHKPLGCRDIFLAAYYDSLVSASLEVYLSSDCLCSFPDCAVVLSSLLPFFSLSSFP